MHGPGNRVPKPWVLLYAGAHFGSYLRSSLSQMINNDIQDADGSPIRFADLEVTLVKFATEARPLKRAFAWYAEQGLRHARKVGWAATQLTVPPTAWGSETCDAGTRDRFFGDALALQSAEVI